MKLKFRLIFELDLRWFPHMIQANFRGYRPKMFGLYVFDIPILAFGTKKTTTHDYYGTFVFICGIMFGLELMKVRHIQQLKSFHRMFHVDEKEQK